MTGYRNQADEWVSRSPGNGHWYRLVDGRRRPGSAPSPDDLGRSDSINWVTTHTEAPDQPVYFSSDAVSFGAGGTDRVSSDEIMRRQWEYQFAPEPIDQAGRRKRTPKVVQRRAA